MAAKKTGKLIVKGNVGIMVTDPITDELAVSWIKVAELPQNGTGIKQLATRITSAEGGLHEVHGDHEVKDIVLAAFPAIVKDKGSEWVIKQMSGVSEDLKKQAELAKINAWNLKIADMTDAVASAKSLIAEREDLYAQIADLDADLGKLKKTVASKLDIDPTFDLAESSEHGFFVSSETKPKGTKTKKTREWVKDEYSKVGTYKAVKDVTRTVKVLHRDDNGNPDQFAVKITCPTTDTYEGSGDIGEILYDVAKPLSDQFIDENAKGFNNALNVYSFFDIS